MQLEKYFSKEELVELWEKYLMIDRRIYRSYVVLLFGWVVRPVLFALSFIILNIGWVAHNGYIIVMELLSKLFTKG